VQIYNRASIPIRPLYQEDAECALATVLTTNPAEYQMSPPPPPEHTNAETTPTALPWQDITGVVLAGGRSQRMGGEDKGLVRIDGRFMINHVIQALSPQVGPLLINANRNLDDYRGLGYPVIPDIIGDFYGPLAGIASALQSAETDYLLCVPCDSPLLPHNLAQALYSALHTRQAEISVAHDGGRMQPVFALLRRNLLADLLTHLETGGRKIETWYARHRLDIVDFSDRADTFFNVNTQQERHMLERMLVSSDSS